MSNGLAVISQSVSDRETRDRLLANVIMKNGSRDQVDLVIAICDRYSLDPLLKHLVLINGSAYITRDGLLHIAHQSGQFDGIEVALAQLGDGEWAATCTVYRKDKSRPFRYTVYQSEHQQGGGGAWGKYPRAMLAKTAEVACLRRAFDVSLGAVEELGYDGESSASGIGQVTVVGGNGGAIDVPPPSRPQPPQPPQPPARSALPPGKVEDYDDDALLTVCGGDYPPAQLRKAATVYFGRAANRDELMDRFKAAYRAGLSREIADPVAKAAGEALKERAPGSYQHHARDDQQPILGDTPDERLAMLARIREAMATSGRDEEAVNKFVYATWRQAGIETLTAAEAEELIAILLARGEEEAAPDAVPERYPDDSDAVPFK